MSRYKSKQLEIPREALLAAIDRCEHGTNPAIVDPQVRGPRQETIRWQR